MAIDSLHEKIRKLKNPLVVDLRLDDSGIPAAENITALQSHENYTEQLLNALKGYAAGVRFSFGAYALFGGEGLETLSRLLQLAAQLDFYVLLDAPEIHSPLAAQQTAQRLLGEDSLFPCDGLIVSPYIGSDALKPFLGICKDQKKDLFATVRSANKTAAEIQDLMIGSRLVHGAAADIVSRHGEGLMGKCAYSQIAAVVSAGAPESLRNMRAKYKSLFLLVDGIDLPSGNAKNCSAAFDRFGYGAAVCAGKSITEAWKEEGSGEPLEAAVQAAERIRKNILRYFSIL